MQQLNILPKLKHLEDQIDLNPFDKGLFASTEMLVDGYLDLYKNGILKNEKNGHIAHAGFIVGSQELYTQLRELPENERRKFNMRSVMKINQLYGSEEEDREQRTNARFVNSCIKITLLGAAVSDTLASGKVISGVGGQYNFVAMAHELEGARSLISCHSTYNRNGDCQSNILFQYGHETIPRHLRDLYITEYGIADCRSKTDAEVIKSILNIADSRFQQKLLNTAKKNGKIAKSYQIPDKYRHNHAANLKKAMLQATVDLNYKHYPFGTALTEDEIKLKDTLSFLKEQSTLNLLLLILHGLITSRNNETDTLLQRMQLTKATSLKLFIYKNLLIGALKKAK